MGRPFKISKKKSARMPQLGSKWKFLTKYLSKFSNQDPVETFWPKFLWHCQAWVYSKFSQESPMSRPDFITIHRPSNIPSHTPRYTLLPFHTKRTSFYTPILPPILLSHPSSFHSPHPDSVPHMGYTRPPSWLHGSHCTRISGWIPPPGPLLDASPGYIRESSRA